MKFYFLILSLKISIVKVCTRQYSPSLNFSVLIQKTTRMCNSLFVKSQRVIILIYDKYFFIEKKTIVFDIDETLVLATINKTELKQVDETIFIKMTRFGG